MKTLTLKTLCILGILILGAYGDASAQIFKKFKSTSFKYRYLRAGASVGITNYRGDITNVSKPGFSLMSSYRFSPSSHVRLSLFHGYAAGTDSKSENSNERIRNLSFRTPIYEASLHYIFDIPIQSRRFDQRPLFAFYVWAGIGYHFFKPQAELNGKWVNLQPLGTEGQNLIDPLGFAEYPAPYEQKGWNIPVGAGIRISPPHQKWDVELEFGWRNIFTDYLDDVSRLYPDLKTLSEDNPLSAELSDRIDRAIFSAEDFPGGAPQIIGTKRGNDQEIDVYIYTSISFNYILSDIEFKARR